LLTEEWLIFKSEFIIREKKRLKILASYIFYYHDAQNIESGQGLVRILWSLYWFLSNKGRQLASLFLLVMDYETNPKNFRRI